MESGKGRGSPRLPLTSGVSDAPSCPALSCAALPCPAQAMDVPAFWDLLIAAIHAADAASPLNAAAEAVAVAVPHHLAGAALN